VATDAVPKEIMMTATATRAQLTGDYDLDVAHTRLGFTARHAMVTKVRGSFKQFQGYLHLDGEDPTQSCGQVVIEAASIDTGSPERDQHLRSNDFFDMTVYPEIVYHTTRIEPIDDDHFRVIGDLKVKGVTRSTELDALFAGAAVDPFGNTRVGFEASGAISRKDFGITWNAMLEGGGVLVSDRITLDIDISAIKRKDR
jgi:polyisoprenoid-binding protein YceI